MRSSFVTRPHVFIGKVVERNEIAPLAPAIAVPRQLVRPHALDAARLDEAARTTVLTTLHPVTPNMTASAAYL